MIQLFQNIRRHRYALRSQFTINLKTTISSTQLGVLWWVLDPLLLMGIYYFFVKIVFERGGPQYHLFALCGIVTWQCFSRTLVLSSTALTRSAGLIRQIALPLELYVVVQPLVQSFYYCIGLGIIFFWNMQAASLASFSLLLPLCALFLFSFSLGCILSIVQVHLRDTAKFLPYLLRLGFYVTPILYAPERFLKIQAIPDICKEIYLANPILIIVTAVREILLEGQLLHVEPVLWLIGVSLILTQCAIAFFRFNARTIPTAL